MCGRIIPDFSCKQIDVEMDMIHMVKPRVLIVAAVSKNGIIGKDGQLPWHLPSDFRRLIHNTMGKPLIMGRKTFESLPALQRGRRHIVMTCNGSWAAEGAEVARSLEEALLIANAPEVAIFGGAQIYALALPLASRIELTEVHLNVEGDAFMPQIGDGWIETHREEFPSEDGRPAYAFVSLLRAESG